MFIKKWRYYFSILAMAVEFLNVSASTPDNFLKNIYCHKSDTSLIISNVRVDLIFPNSLVEGTILVLPGWNFKCNDICQKSDFCQKAKREGYVLIMPDMLKSIYASQLYPETRKDWLKYPTLHLDY